MRARNVRQNFQGGCRAGNGKPTWIVMRRNRQPGNLACKRLGRLTRTENDSHAAGAIRDLLMQAAEVDDANRGFQLENAGGLRWRNLAYTVSEHESRTSPLPFQRKIRRALDGENQRLRNAGLCEPLS